MPKPIVSGLALQYARAGVGSKDARVLQSTLVSTETLPFFLL